MPDHLKEQFEEPKIVATYGKNELEEAIRPQLLSPVYDSMPV